MKYTVFLFFFDLKNTKKGILYTSCFSIQKKKQKKHIFMFFNEHENDRVHLYDTLYNFDPSLRGIFSLNPEKVLFWLLGQ